MTFAVTQQSRFDARSNNFDLIRLVAAMAVVYGHAYSLAGDGGAGGGVLAPGRVARAALTPLDAPAGRGPGQPGHVGGVGGGLAA